jgi:hypothetical protein
MRLLDYGYFLLADHGYSMEAMFNVDYEFVAHDDVGNLIDLAEHYAGVKIRGEKFRARHKKGL